MVNIAANTYFGFGSSNSVLNAMRNTQANLFGEWNSRIWILICKVGGLILEATQLFARISMWKPGYNWEHKC